MNNELIKRIGVELQAGCWDIHTIKVLQDCRAALSQSAPVRYVPMTDVNAAVSEAIAEMHDLIGENNSAYSTAYNSAVRTCISIIERAFIARLPKPDAEPVAWAMPNSAITDSNRFMMVRLEVPSDDEYGGAFWIPLYAHPPKPDAEPVARVNSEGFIVEIGDISLAEGTLLYTSPTKPDHVPASPEVEAQVDAAVEAGRINDNRDADHIVDANKMVSDTAEREALLRRIDEALAIECSDLCSLFRDIRAHLVGGGE